MKGGEMREKDFKKKHLRPNRNPGIFSLVSGLRLKSKVCEECLRAIDFFVSRRLIHALLVLVL